MQMLHAGGVPLCTDAARQPDSNNPRGYFECEAVKSLAKDTSWLWGELGKAIKIVVPLIDFVPSELPARVLLVTRDLVEVTMSQATMIASQTRTGAALSDERLRTVLAQQLERSRQRLRQRSNVSLLEIEYAKLIECPLATAEDIVEFLARDLDTAKMAAVIDPSLYRNRV